MKIGRWGGAGHGGTCREAASSQTAADRSSRAFSSPCWPPPAAGCRGLSMVSAGTPLPSPGPHPHPAPQRHGLKRADTARGTLHNLVPIAPSLRLIGAGGRWRPHWGV